MAKQMRDELRLVQLLKEDKRLGILKDLDIFSTISDHPSAIKNKAALGGYNCLHMAVMKSDLDLLQKLLSLGANILQQGTQDGKTPLRKAVDFAKNYKGIPVWKLMGVLREHCLVNTLLSTQIKSNNSFNAKCKNGISHLHIASMFNCAEAVLFFVRNGKSVDQVINVDSDIFPGFTPLHCAIQYSASEAAATLLTFGADIYLENAQGINSVNYLIERLLDAHDYFNLTVDEYCCYPYEKEIERLDSIVKLITLKYRTDDSKLIEKTGLSSFHLACTLKDDWIMQSYVTHEWARNDFKELNKQVTCHSKIWSGWTPLHFAACCNMKTFQILLENRANISIKNLEGETALDLCLRRHSPIVALSPLSLDTVLTDKSTILSDLISAISEKNSCKQFLKNLKDVNISMPLNSPYWSGCNLLHMSISMNHKVKLLEVFSSETDYPLKPGSGVCLPRKNSSTDLYWTRIEILLNKGCSVHAKNGDGLTPIHLAFKLRKWHLLEELLAHANQNIVGADNLSFLHIACAMGKLDVVERLLKQGTNVNSIITGSLAWNDEIKPFVQISYPSKFLKVSIGKNSTPLHIAVIFQMELVVEKLMKNHADVYAEDELGYTPIHLALASIKKIACLLLSDTTNLKDVRTKAGLTHLHVAAFADDEKAVKKLLQDGAEVNSFIENSVPDSFAAFVGKTPLHLAIENENITRIVIEKGANIFAENLYCSNGTPLDLAMNVINSIKLKALFEKLKHKDIPIGTLTSSGLTNLHIACATLDIVWIRKLLQRGADPNLQMSDGHTPMHLVIANAISKRTVFQKLAKFIELLSKYSADVTISDNNCNTPLHLIAEAYSEESRADKAILLSTADLMLSNQKSYASNPSDTDGFSHFHFACRTNNLVVIRNFLDNGVYCNHTKSPFAEENGGFTPLHFAIENKNGDVVRLLLERGSDATIQDKLGNTPLHSAVLNTFIDLQLLDAFIKNGADINARNCINKTPFVCLLSHIKLTYEQFLFFISRGFLINITEKIYETEGVIGYTMENTEENDVESVFGAFIEFCNIKAAISKGFMAIHNLVSVRKSKNLSRLQYLKFIKRFVEEGSHIDEQDENGKSAIEVAIKFRNFHAIEALLLLGANINFADIEQSFSPVLRLYKPFIFPHGGESESFIRKHLWKMALVKFELSNSDRKIIQEWKLGDNFEQLCQTELEKTKQTRIFRTLTANHFLSEWEAVIDYPTMSVAEREAVDNFFKDDDALRKEFPEFAGLLTMQYRKAFARRILMQPVKDILIAAGIDLPDLCLEAILEYLKNSELNYLIKEEQEMSPPCKRRKIQ